MYNISQIPFAKPMTDREQYIFESKESIYKSSQICRLGRSPSPSSAPKGVRNWTFGKPSVFYETVADLMAPAEPQKQLGLSSSSSDICKNTLKCGLDRKTNSAGIKTSHDCREMKKLLQNEYDAVSKRKPDEEFLKRNRNFEKKALEKRISELPHDPDFKCYSLKQDQSYNLDPVRLAKKNFRIEDGCLNILIETIKKKNHHHFQDLKSAFDAYDQRQSGTLSAADVYRMCQKFGLIVKPELIDKLMIVCGQINKDGKLSFEEFIIFLNWKEKFPPIHDDSWYSTNLLQPGVEERIMINNHCVTALDSEIIALKNIKNEGKFIEAGLPTVRSDISLYRRRRLDDNANYGEIQDISSLLSPGGFANCGVNEMDLHLLRNKEEIKCIFFKGGFIQDLDLFEVLWNHINFEEKVSIANFYQALWHYNCNTRISVSKALKQLN